MPSFDIVAQTNNSPISSCIVAIDQLIWERHGCGMMFDTVNPQGHPLHTQPKLEPHLRDYCQLSRVKTEHLGNSCMEAMDTIDSVHTKTSGAGDYSIKEEKSHLSLEIDEQSKVKQLALSVKSNNSVARDNALLNMVYNNGIQGGVIAGHQITRGDQVTFGHPMFARNVGKLTRANLSSYDSNCIDLKQRVEDYLIELDVTQAYSTLGDTSLQGRTGSEGSTLGSAGDSTRGSGREGQDVPKPKSKRGRKPGQCK